MPVPERPDGEKQNQNRHSKKQLPMSISISMRSVHPLWHYFGFRLAVGSWRFGTMRGGDPAIAAPSDRLDEDGVFGGISERVAQTVDGADDTAIEVDIN